MSVVELERPTVEEPVSGGVVSHYDFLDPVPRKLEASWEPRVTEITRAQLLEITELMFRLFETHYRERELSNATKEEFRLLAQTVSRVAGKAEWWDHDEQCGCLVGHRLKTHIVISAVDFALGGLYVDAMDAVTGVATPFRAPWLTVVD